MSGDIARVDRLDNAGQPGGGGPVGGPPQIVDIDAFAVFLVAPLRPETRHCVQQRALRRAGVEDRLVDAVAKFLLPTRQRRKAALAAVPVAGNSIEQRQRQAVTLKPLGDRLGRVIIGEKELDPLNPARAAASNRSRNPMS